MGSLEEFPIEMSKTDYDRLIANDIQWLKIGDLQFIRRDQVEKMVIDFSKSQIQEFRQLALDSIRAL